MSNKNEEEEEPSPELLQINQNQNYQIENPNFEIEQNYIQNIQNSSKTKITENKNNSSRIKTNTNINTSKISKNSYIPQNKFENHNIQNLTYALMKDYSQLHINKDEDFMERMKFDIYKRQIRDDRINKLIEQNKMKINEEERIKAFNRLIEDANRRIEAQENLEIMKNKLEDDLINPNTKKYNDIEWKEIYQKRFENYNNKVNEKIEKLKKEKNDKIKKKEEEEIKLCPIKKASKKHIEEASKRMYEEAIKRKLKMDEKKDRINNIENDTNKYKKTIKSEAYSFLDDDNEISQKKNFNYNQRFSKKKGQSVTEFNNQRFDIRNKPKIFNDYNRPLYGNYNKNKKNNNFNDYNYYNLNKNYFEENKDNENNNENNEFAYDNNNNNNENNQIIKNNEKNNFDEYEEKEIKNIPKPIGMAKELMLNEIGNNINKKKLEEVALKKLSQRNDNVINGNDNENNDAFSYNTNNINSNEASKIVQHFFSNNLNH